MSNSRQYPDLNLPSDAEVLKHFTRLELATTPTSEADFSALLAANYHEMVPAFAQSIKGLRDCRQLRDAELRRAHSSNEKQFSRYMDGTISIPLELVKAWIETLCEFQFDAVVTLFRHNGLLPMVPTTHSVVVNMSTASGEFADFLKSMSPILADGKMDKRDLPHIPEALLKIEQLMSVLGSLRETMLKVKDDNKIELQPRWGKNR